MDDLFGPYQRTRARVCTLLVEATPDDLTRTVPACPDWTVHDLAAHLVGTPAELAAGRFPTGSDFTVWLQDIVDARRDDDIASLVDEWQTLDGAIEPMLQGPGALMFGDVSVHEHDLRGALGRADHDALEVDELATFALGAFADPARNAGVGAIVVESDGRTWRSHDADAGWTLHVEPWDAVRAVYSRRTADELRALPADGDPEPYVALIAGHLPLPEHSLGE
jgi:uncharacterized protein (TIGR03083 family)